MLKKVNRLKGKYKGITVHVYNNKIINLCIKEPTYNVQQTLAHKDEIN